MRLGAILLNPPLIRRGKTTTEHNLEIVTQLLGCSEYGIANLFAQPTKDMTEIREQGVDPVGWESARPHISKLVHSSDQVLIGWGRGGIVGEARRHFHDQVGWTYHCLKSSDHNYMWQVGGGARHPSRWRQFVGPVRGIARGDSFEERLGSVLERIDISALPTTDG